MIIYLVELKIKNAEPFQTLFLKLVIYEIYYFYLLFTPARPKRPIPKSNIVAGSGLVIDGLIKRN